MIYSEKWFKNNPEFVKKTEEKIALMTNEKLLKAIEKTDDKVIPYLFKEEYKFYLENAKPEYGEASRRLYEDIKDIDKKDFIILTVFNSDVENEKLSNKKIQFVPFNKIFIQTSIPFIDAKNQLCIVDSVILIKNKDINSICCHFRIKYIKDRTRRQQMCLDLNENELNLPLSKEANNYDNCDWSGLNHDELAKSSLSIGLKLRNLIRFISYKLSTHEYKSYLKYQNGELIEKEIVYSSEVKAHKRHFWEDSGKFIIPTLSEEEIINRGYFIDDVVFKDNELRQNVPYTIIGNFERNKEKEKINRKIDLFKKRIWRQEENIYTILREIYPDKIIRRHDRKTLKGIELDFNIPELRLGIEYDGEQHFDKKLYEKLYGEGFGEQVKRDRKKDRLCIKKNIKLIRIKYDENISKRLIQKKIKEVSD